MRGKNRNFALVRRKSATTESRVIGLTMSQSYVPSYIIPPLPQTQVFPSSTAISLHFHIYQFPFEMVPFSLFINAIRMHYTI